MTNLPSIPSAGTPTSIADIEQELLQARDLTSRLELAGRAGDRSQLGLAGQTWAPALAQTAILALEISQGLESDDERVEQGLADVELGLCAVPAFACELSDLATSAASGDLSLTDRLSSLVAKVKAMLTETLDALRAVRYTLETPAA